MSGLSDVKYLHLRFKDPQFWSFSQVCWEFFEWARESLDNALSRASEWIAWGLPMFAKTQGGNIEIIFDDDPRVVLLTESAKLGGLYPVHEPPGWMHEVFIYTKHRQVQEWLFSFEHSPTEEEIAERRKALRKQIEIDDVNLAPKLAMSDLIQPNHDSQKSTAGTILDDMLSSGFKLGDLEAAASKGLKSAYIAALILRSSEVFARSTQPWEYKSLAHWAEENFVLHSYASSWMDWNQGNPSFSKDWVGKAQQDFAKLCFENSLYEEEEGLLFYVREANGTYRQARQGDAPYDFVCRLRSDDGVQGMGFLNPPSWSEELFLNRNNYDVYRMFWFDLDYVDRAEGKRLKRDAVLRESRRLNGEQHRLTEREAKLAKSAEDFERGLQKLRELPRPLSYQMVNVVDLAERIASGRGIHIEEALGHIWQTTVHDESFFLFELGTGLPQDVGPAAINREFIDRTALNDPLEDLAWLKGRAFTPADAEEIFNALPRRDKPLAGSRADAADPHGYADPTNERYAPKLAAAVRAWQSVTSQGKRTPKQAMEKWLTEHATELRIADSTGKPVKQAIEEIAKVANWNTTGGAPRMPG